MDKVSILKTMFSGDELSAEPAFSHVFQLLEFDPIDYQAITSCLREQKWDCHGEVFARVVEAVVVSDSTKAHLWLMHHQEEFKNGLKKDIPQAYFHGIVVGLFRSSEWLDKHDHNQNYSSHFPAVIAEMVFYGWNINDEWVVGPGRYISQGYEDLSDQISNLVKSWVFPDDESLRSTRMKEVFVFLERVSKKVGTGKDEDGIGYHTGRKIVDNLCHKIFHDMSRGERLKMLHNHLQSPLLDN
ncbi:MAG: hypothetical protein V1838_03965 [Patescibacteria group bacterium]